MLIRTGIFRIHHKSKQEWCKCDCGIEQWVKIKGSVPVYETCGKCKRKLKFMSKPEDTERVCRVCKEKKPISEFVNSKTGSNLCLVCNRINNKINYKKYPIKRKLVNERYKKNQELIIQNKNAPCVTCGKSFHFAAMDFNHIDQSSKFRDVAKMLHLKQETILAEINKCELICSNCHRDKTQRELVDKYKSPDYSKESWSTKRVGKRFVDKPLIEGDPSKVCKICNTEKPLSSFNKRKLSNNRMSTRCECKTCAYELKTVYREKNKDYLAKRRLKRGQEAAEWFESYKDNKQCADCGETFRYWMLDYDHREDKLYKPGHLKKTLKSRETIMKELAKCDLVCSNCHRIRTWKRQQEAKKNKSL